MTTHTEDGDAVKPYNNRKRRRKKKKEEKKNLFHEKNPFPILISHRRLAIYCTAQM
jgi:hypothetical protein